MSGVTATGVFLGVGTSDLFAPSPGEFSASLGTFTGSIQLERNRNNGSGWLVVAKDTSGTGAIYTSGPIDLDVEQAVRGTQFRWNCTLLTSGTPSWETCQ